MKLEYYRTPCGRHSTDISASSCTEESQNRPETSNTRSPSQEPKTTHFRRSSHQTQLTNSFTLPTLSLLLLCTLACLISASSIPENPTSTSPTITGPNEHLLRQFRHRLTSQQHRRHHYYSALLLRARQARARPNSPSTQITPVSTTSPVVPSWSRHHRSHHYYHHHHHLHNYFHYDHDQLLSTKNKTEEEEAKPVNFQNWSSRSNSARLLKDRPSSSTPKIIYQLNGITSDEQLPECAPLQVCNKVDTYSTPWIEKQCRCPQTSSQSFTSCSESLSANDGHTVVEKTKLYKTCQPVKTLPTCRYFRDITWTLTTTLVKKGGHSGASSYSNSVPNHPHHQDSENITRQEMKCLCPPASVAYISRHHVVKEADGSLAYQYHFACSPETKLRCKRKEPCRLFTSRKRSKVEEVNTNTLCQCPSGTSCPATHRHPSVLTGSSSSSSSLDNLKTYSAYCYPDNSGHQLSDENDNENQDQENKYLSKVTETTSDEVTEGKLRSPQLTHSTKDSATTTQQGEKYHFSLLRR